MEKINNSTAITLTLLLGIFLQVLFVFADTVNTPDKTVVAFSKAYFKLDPSMAQYLCNDLVEGEEGDIVDRFLQNAVLEANGRGFQTGYLKSYLFEVVTQTLTRSEDSARIRITCKRKKSINPVYAIVAKIFFLGNTYAVDEIVDLVKEDGKWKVCGKPFSLT